MKRNRIARVLIAIFTVLLFVNTGLASPAAQAGQNKAATNASPTPGPFGLEARPPGASSGNEIRYAPKSASIAHAQ